MSGFPRPTYSGDFQGSQLLFPDLSGYEYTLTNTFGTGSWVTVAKMSVSDIVAGDMYEIVFENFQMGSNDDPTSYQEVIDAYNLAACAISLTYNKPSSDGTTSSAVQPGELQVIPIRWSDSQKYAKAYFVAPETGTYTFRAQASYSHSGYGDERTGWILLQYTLFGVRGIGNPSTNSEINNNVTTVFGPGV